jgi:hypothetical protein
MLREHIRYVRSPKMTELIFLISECIMFIFVTMLFMVLLWVYAPYSVGWKMTISFVSITIYYDVFKHFVHTKWVLFKSG